MAQKPVLRLEVSARALRVRSVPREEAWASTVVRLGVCVARKHASLILCLGGFLVGLASSLRSFVRKKWPSFCTAAFTSAFPTPLSGTAHRWAPSLGDSRSLSGDAALAKPLIAVDASHGQTLHFCRAGVRAE